MDLKAAGLAFIVAAIVLVGFLLIDQGVGEDRHKSLRPNYSPSIFEFEEEDEDSVPSIDWEEDERKRTRRIGVSSEFDLRAPTEHDILSREEFHKMSTGEDYEYTIKKGETIDSVARKFLGDNNAKDYIFQVNPGLRGKTFETGVKITIPFRFRR